MTYEDISKDVLRSIKSPCDHMHVIETEEFTLYGSKGKPDFGHLVIELDIKEGADAPELKSVKAYFAQYRNCIVSYERAAGLLRDHFMEFYDPSNVDVTLAFKPRGGIKSKIMTWGWNEQAKTLIDKALNDGDEIDITV